MDGWKRAARSGPVQIVRNTNQTRNINKGSKIRQAQAYLAMTRLTILWNPPTIVVHLQLLSAQRGKDLGFRWRVERSSKLTHCFATPIIAKPSVFHRNEALQIICLVNTVLWMWELDVDGGPGEGNRSIWKQMLQIYVGADGCQSYWFMLALSVKYV